MLSILHDPIDELTGTFLDTVINISQLAEGPERKKRPLEDRWKEPSIREFRSSLGKAYQAATRA